MTEWIHYLKMDSVCWWREWDVVESFTFSTVSELLTENFSCHQQLYYLLCRLVGRSTKISPFFGSHRFFPRRLKFGMEVAAIANSYFFPFPRIRINFYPQYWTCFKKNSVWDQILQNPCCFVLRKRCCSLSMSLVFFFPFF